MKYIDVNKSEMSLLIQKVKTLLHSDNDNEAYELIKNSMSDYPDNPEPHNLMGIFLEKQSLHSSAMNHFRAAYALDATYLPSRHNLDAYGTMFFKGIPAYDESDCEVSDTKKYEIIYDENKIGRIVQIKKETK